MKSVRLSSSSSVGRTAVLAERITKNWLLGLRETNPAILDMFRERDTLPYRELLPWSGEFAGKYITGAYFIYRLTLDKKLFDYIQTFIDELLTLQDKDGYLGVFSRQCHLTGAWSQTPGVHEGTWDAWSHYHIMFGLLLWYRETGDERYLACVERAAGLFLRTFYGGTGHRLSEIGWTEMNLAPVHVFAILYNLTKKPEYLAFAKNVEEDFQSPNAGDYIRYALRGIEFFQCPKPRWESMHAVLGAAELYRATGEAYYLDAASFIFRSILRTDVHNTGAFSTNEGAVGNPFAAGHIESCCVIAYNALAIDLLMLTDDASILDFLEISHYNACFGMWSPTGRWSTYDTPMNGDRRANFHDIGFQCRPGSPELNCCSVNTPRGVGSLSAWRLTDADGVLCVNCWEPGTFITEDGVTVKIDGQYPAPGRVVCTVSGYTGTLRLRVPGWSGSADLTINGETRRVPSGYAETDCPGSVTVSLDFDFSARFSDGEGEEDGHRCLYRGPLLFGADTSRAAGYNVDDLPPLSAAAIAAAPVRVTDGVCTIPLPNGITLVEFFRLGDRGGRYRTWLTMSE